MDYAPFKEGTIPVGAPFELTALPPESPLPPWSHEERNALLVVAHPDDEILFAGGLMLYYPEWKWTLVTATDPGREWQQAKCIDLLSRWGVRVESHNLGYTDAFLPRARFAYAESLANLPYRAHVPDIVFTHGFRGEYGHHHHVWTHFAVHMAYENVWDFLHPNPRVKQLRKTLVREIPVDARKRNIFGNAYGQIAGGLRANAPWITERMDTLQPEYFTQAVVGI